MSQNKRKTDEAVKWIKNEGKNKNKNQKQTQKQTNKKTKTNEDN